MPRVTYAYQEYKGLQKNKVLQISRSNLVFPEWRIRIKDKQFEIVTYRHQRAGTKVLMGRLN